MLALAMPGQHAGDPREKEKDEVQVPGGISGSGTWGDVDPSVCFGCQQGVGYLESCGQLGKQMCFFTTVQKGREEDN